MNKKRVISILMICSLVIGVFGGCSSSNQGAQSVSSSSQASAQSSTDESKTVEINKEDFKNSTANFNTGILEQFSENAVSQSKELSSKTISVNPNAKEIDSIYGDDIDKLIKKALNDEMISKDEAVNVLSEVDGYVKNGAFKTNGMITEVENDSSKVRKVGASNDANGAYIIVVDENCFVVSVTDEDKQPIAGAKVTISFVDDNGNRKTYIANTSDGANAGLAIFDGLPSTRYGLVDVQKDGYHSFTMLDTEITGGMTETVSLIGNDGNPEVYLRSADLAGVDMLNSATSFSLYKKTNNTYTFSAIISKTNDNAVLPDKIYLYAEGEENPRATFENPEYFKIDKETDSSSYLFTLEADWFKTGAGLLKAEDRLYFMIGDTKVSLGGITIEEAIYTPSFKTDVPLPLSESASAEIPVEEVKSELFSLGADVLSVNVSIGVFDDGHYFVYVGKEFSDGFSSLFHDCESPKTKEKTVNIFKSMKSHYEDNYKAFENGYAKLNGSKTPWLSDKSYNLTLTINAFLEGGYNKETKRQEGNLSVCVAGDFNYSITEYFLVTAGPFVIPFYGGIFLDMNAAATGNIGTFSTDAGKSGLSFEPASEDPFDLDLVIQAGIYIGVGIRGLVCLEADGSGKVDFKLMCYDEAPAGKVSPRFLIQTGINASIIINALFVHTSVDLYSKSWTAYDSWAATSDSLGDRVTVNSSQLKRVSFDELNEKLLVRERQTGDELTSYTAPVANGIKTIGGNQTISTIAENTLSNNGIQYVSTSNYGVLFRIAIINGKSCLIYQYYDRTTGQTKDVVYKVDMPENLSVMEFKAINNRASDVGSYGDYVYIAAVIADDSKEDRDERSKTTKVVATTLSLGDNVIKQNRIVSNPNDHGKKYFYEAQPIGRGDTCIALYSQSEKYSTKDKSEFILANIDGGFTNISVQNKYGAKHVFTTGVIADWAPCVWAEGILDRTTEVTYYGYDASGNNYSDAGNYDIRFDLGGYDPTGNEQFTSWWTCVNGVNYFIANGKLYYTYYEENIHSWSGYDIHAKEILTSNGESLDIVNTFGINEIFMSADKSALYIVGVKKNYSVNEAGDSVFDNSELQIFTVCKDSQGNVFLHGPGQIKLKDVNMSHFTALVNNSGSARGLSVFYTVENPAYITESGKVTSCNLYQWNQNDAGGIKVVDFKLDSPSIKKGEMLIGGTVTVKDMTTIEPYGLLRLKINDGNGNYLTQTDAKGNVVDQNTAGAVYNAGYMFFGDEAKLKVYFKADPCWASNTYQKLIVTVTDPVYSGDNSLEMVIDDPIFSVSGQNSFRDDTHYADIIISNSSFVKGEEPVVKVFAVFENKEEKELLKTVSLGGETALTASASFSNENATLSIPMDDIWRNHGNEIMGVEIVVFDKDKECSNGLYLQSPVYDESRNIRLMSATPEKEEPKNTDSTVIILIIIACIVIAAGVFAVVYRRKKTSK